MIKFARILNTTDFESSSGPTPQFKSFMTTYRADMKRLLKDIAERVEINRGHFDSFGFIMTKRGKCIYFSIPDVRWGDKKMLIRSARDFKDYTGGQNHFVPIDSMFETELHRTLEKLDSMH